MPRSVSILHLNESHNSIHNKPENDHTDGELRGVFTCLFFWFISGSCVVNIDLVNNVLLIQIALAFNALHSLKFWLELAYCSWNWDTGKAEKCERAQTLGKPENLPFSL